MEFVPIGTLYGGLRVNSVEFGDDGYLYVGAESSLWRLELSREGERFATEKHARARATAAAAKQEL